MFLARIKEMPDDRWPKAILNMIEMCKIKTSYIKRERELYFRFQFDTEMSDNEADNRTLATFQKKVKAQIKSVLDENWKEGMRNKTSLSRYREYKQCRGDIEHFYDNSRGSMLLANARAGFLRTRTFRKRFENIDETCQRCKTSQETLEHVIMECDDQNCSEEEIRKRLGLLENSSRKIVADTKRRLERWERETTHMD